MDRRRPGAEWSWRLSQALATCRVFVPLYSRRYFKSEHCGREWSAFASRAVSQEAREGRAESVIPALWVPVPQEDLPEEAKAIQSHHGDLGDRLYAENGFYGIMKVSRFREDYEHAVYELARRIIEVAERAPVEPGPAMGYEDLESAFGQTRPTESDGPNVLVTIAAPDITALPSGRDSAYYGSLPWTGIPIVRSPRIRSRSTPSVSPGVLAIYRKWAVSQITPVNCLALRPRRDRRSFSSIRGQWASPTYWRCCGRSTGRTLPGSAWWCPGTSRTESRRRTLTCSGSGCRRPCPESFPKHAPRW